MVRENICVGIAYCCLGSLMFLRFWINGSGPFQWSAQRPTLRSGIRPFIVGRATVPAYIVRPRARRPPLSWSSYRHVRHPSVPEKRIITTTPHNSCAYGIVHNIFRNRPDILIISYGMVIKSSLPAGTINTLFQQKIRGVAFPSAHGVNQVAFNR